MEEKAEVEEEEVVGEVKEGTMVDNSQEYRL